MEIIFDVVDLLQLYELWGRRPIVTAFTRLERRQAVLPSQHDFRIETLMPRLMRLKHSRVWLVNQPKANADPGHLPLGDFSDESLEVLYPDSPAENSRRQILFEAFYNEFVISRFQAGTLPTCNILRALSGVTTLKFMNCLDYAAMPQAGSEYWIPADLTDSIRALDGRYNPAEVNTPAAYVIAENFWEMLTKVEDQDMNRVIAVCCEDAEADCGQAYKTLLEHMIGVAREWNRSPSVVGLCYQREV